MRDYIFTIQIFLIEHFIFVEIMGGVQENLRPTHSEKTLGALKAERAVKRITFDRRTEANPQETIFCFGAQAG